MNTKAKESTTKEIPLLIRSTQWTVAERTENQVSAVCLKNNQDDITMQMNQKIVQQNQINDQQNQKIDSQNKLINQQSQMIEQINQKIEQQNQMINQQNQMIEQQNKKIDDLNDLLHLQENKNAELRNRIEKQDNIEQNKNKGKTVSRQPMPDDDVKSPSSGSRKAILMADSNPYSDATVFRSSIKRNEISAIYTKNTLKYIPSSAWDVSDSKDGSVMAWTGMASDGKSYILYLAANGNIYANPDCSFLFADYTNLTTVNFNHLKTDLVNNMCGMFAGCEELKHLVISKWDVSNVTDMTMMFYDCQYMNSMDKGALSSWKLNPSITMENICGLTKYKNNPMDLFDKNQKQTEPMNSTGETASKSIILKDSTVKSPSTGSQTAVLMADSNTDPDATVFGSNIKRSEISAIYTKNTLKYIPSSAWDVSHSRDGSVMAWTGMASDGKSHILYLAADGDIYANPDCHNLFANYTNLTTVNFRYLQTDQVTNMRGMFEQCNNLKQLDVSHWNVSNVTNIRAMFSHCEQLQTLDVSYWDISNVTYTQDMFYYCEQLKTLDVSHWNVSNVINMWDMFHYCKQLQTLDVSHWNVSKVTNMSGMFFRCEQLKTLDVSHWDVSNVTNMNGMFFCCEQLQTLDVSHWDISNVTNMRSMFFHCEQLQTLDVSHWNVSNVKIVEDMFSYCPYINQLEKGALSSWDLKLFVNRKNICQGTKYEKNPKALFQKGFFSK